jgi:hypothetical protein
MPVLWFHRTVSSTTTVIVADPMTLSVMVIV